MAKRKLEIISRFLTPAITFWLKTQLESVENLDIKIVAGDTKILRGKIDEVSLTTSKVIYEGIHVDQANVKTEKIAVNLGGVLRGKPLKLLQPIFVEGEISLTPDDLKTSLRSSLLAQGLVDLVVLLLEEKQIDNAESLVSKYQFSWQDISLFANKFILNATVSNSQGEKNPLVITANLTLKDNHTLDLSPIEIEGLPDLSTIVLSDFSVDLGTDVEIEQLILSETGLSCQGKAKVVS